MIGKMFHFLCLAALLLSVGSGVSWAEEVYKDVSLEVELDSPEQITVHEKIVFVAEGHQISRGIGHSWPKQYPSLFGKARAIQVSYVANSALIDGLPANVTFPELPGAKDKGGYYRILAVAPKPLAKGTHTLEISYRIQGIVKTSRTGVNDMGLFFATAGNLFPVERATIKFKRPGRDWGEGLSSVKGYVNATTDFRSNPFPISAEKDHSIAVDTVIPPGGYAYAVVVWKGK